MWQDVPNNEILEELFQVFNLSSPQDFEGHSLSVSDVIALKRNGEVSVPYVDSIGFKELPGFLDTKPERPSAVSYTHLDVYKRQAWNRRWRKAKLPSAPLEKG